MRPEVYTGNWFDVHDPFNLQSSLQLTCSERERERSSCLTNAPHVEERNTRSLRRTSGKRPARLRWLGLGVRRRCAVRRHRQSSRRHRDEDYNRCLACHYGSPMLLSRGLSSLAIQRGSVRSASRIQNGFLGSLIHTRSLSHSTSRQSPIRDSIFMGDNIVK